MGSGTNQTKIPASAPRTERPKGPQSTLGRVMRPETDTRLPSLPYSDTTRHTVRKRVGEIHDIFQSWRKVAKAIGEYSPAYWLQVSRGTLDPTDAAVEAVLEYDEQFGGRITVPLCPTCGIYHGPQTDIDCHGNPVRVLVHVSSPPTRAKRHSVSLPEGDFAEINSWREARGMSWVELLRRGMTEESRAEEDPPEKSSAIAALDSQSD